MAAISVLARDTATNRIVHISDVSEGYDKAECVDCKGKLVASNLNPGRRKVACYFRHEGRSNCSGMTALHMFAQQLIQEQRHVYLPSFSHIVSGKDSNGDLHSLQFLKEGYLDKLTDISLETPYPGSSQRSDVSGVDKYGRSLYIEIKVHHEVDVDKRQSLQTAELDVIEIDLHSLVDQEGLTRQQLVDAVIHSAPRQWVSQCRFDSEIEALHRQLETEIEGSDQRILAERKRARVQRSDAKKSWRLAHQEDLELIVSYGKAGNRRKALKQFQDRCTGTSWPENAIYEDLLRRYGCLPNIVNIPVKGELAFRAHRIYWQTLIFREVIQGMYDKTRRKIASQKKKNRRYYYGDEVAWLSELPGITPGRVYQVLMEKRLILTKVAQVFQDLAGQPLQEAYSTRPEQLQFVKAKEYEIIPKPIPAIRRYLNALARLDILDPSGDIYFMQYQDRPGFMHRVENYPAIKGEGLKQYID